MWQTPPQAPQQAAVAPPSLKPLHFGAADRPLFGLFHPPEAGGAATGSPVLLIEPFGHEVIRTQRLYRVLADRLSRTGHAVLRFSAYGAGDSGGDDSDLSLSGWVDDLLTAHQELQRLAGRAPAHWVGARLGAAVALLATHGVTGRPAPRPQLLLWDPVIDGRGYQASLREHHVRALTQSFNLPDPSWREALADPEAYAGEAIGFAMSPSLQAELAALTPAVLVPAAGSTVQLLLGPDERVAADWAARQSPPVTPQRLAQAFEWTSDDSLNTALVPADVLNQLLRMIHG